MAVSGRSETAIFVKRNGGPDRIVGIEDPLYAGRLKIMRNCYF